MPSNWLILGIPTTSTESQLSSRAEDAHARSLNAGRNTVNATMQASNARKTANAVIVIMVSQILTIIIRVAGCKSKFMLDFVFNSFIFSTLLFLNTFPKISQLSN